MIKHLQELLSIESVANHGENRTLTVLGLLKRWSIC